ncbi:MAG: hypothetical protein P8M22_10865 [Phycisphaerales bacterium]|nr:hypothetical protein [Phycisphaerales bacterium]
MAQFNVRTHQGELYESLDVNQLKELARTGIIKLDDEILKVGTDRWIPASKVKGLFEDTEISTAQTQPAEANAAQGNTIPQSHDERISASPPPPPPPAPVQMAQGADPGMGLLIPINRSGWSIAAGYLGLLSLLPFVCFFAVIISLIAFYDFRRRPEMQGRGRATFGLIMGGLFSMGYILVFIMYFSQEMMY